jgi:hypothetical protein
VYNWADADWEHDRGELTVFGQTSGSHSLGTTTLAADRFQASGDGAFIAYPTIAPEAGGDAGRGGAALGDAGSAASRSHGILIAQANLENNWTILENVGRGDMDTCRAKYGFEGRDFYVAWCEPGARGATLERFRFVDGQWEGEQLATGVQPNWTLDEAGEQILVITTASEALVLEDSVTTSLDRGVTWAQFVADGTEVLYTVSDQLRRTSISNVDPIPIVTRDFRYRGAFDGDFSHVLYSNTITYEGGQRSDLHLSRTDAYNPSPDTLVGQPEAVLPRSGFTTSGNYAMYLTDVARTGLLRIREIDGGAT